MSVEHSILSSPNDTHNMAVMRSSDTEVTKAPQCKVLKCVIEGGGGGGGNMSCYKIARVLRK